MVETASQHNKWEGKKHIQDISSSSPMLSSKILRVGNQRDEKFDFTSKHRRLEQGNPIIEKESDNDDKPKRRRIMSAVTVAGPGELVNHHMSSRQNTLEPRVLKHEPNRRVASYYEPQAAPDPLPRQQNPSLMDPAIRSRDKRMFGALMGHLGAAQRRLDKDRVLIDGQAKVVQAVSTKQQEQSSKLKKMQQESIQRKKNMELARRAEKEMQALVAERNRITQFWLKAQEPLRSVMVTSALPPLTWIPNEHNDITLAMANAHCKAVDSAMMERVEQDRLYAEKLDAEIESKYPGARKRKFGATENRRLPSSDPVCVDKDENVHKEEHMSKEEDLNEDQVNLAIEAEAAAEAVEGDHNDSEALVGYDSDEKEKDFIEEVPPTEEKL